MDRARGAEGRRRGSDRRAGEGAGLAMPVVAPSILAPRTGSVDVDFKAPIIIRTNKFGDATGGLSYAREWKSATTDHGGDWATPSGFTRAAYSQSGMASGSAGDGYAQVVSWDGVNYTASSTAKLRQVILWCQAMGEFSNPPNHKGSCTLRLSVAYKGEHWGQWYIEVSPIAWVNTSATPADRNPGWYFPAIYSLLKEMLDKDRLTIADLEALGTDLKITISNISGRSGSFVTTWHAGPIQLGAEYYSGAQPKDFGSYQIQVASDSGFSTVVYDTGRIYVPDYNHEERIYHTIPPDTLLGSDAVATYYVRAKHWDSSSTASAYGAANTFSTLTTGAAEILHGTGRLTPVVDLYPRRYLDQSNWSKTAGRTRVYQSPFVRADEPVSNFTIADIEEDGVAKSYTEVYTVADVDSTTPSFYWDEDAGILYVHCSQDGSPSGLRAYGVCVILRWGVSTRSLISGPSGVQGYDGRVLDLSLSGGIGEFLQQKKPTGGGSLHLSNAAGGNDPSGSGWTVGTPLFHKLVSQQRGGWPADPGWLFHLTRCEISFVTDGVPYSQRLRVFRGVLSMSERNFLNGDRASFDLISRDWNAYEGKVGTQKITTSTWPALNVSENGATIPDQYGGACGDLKAFVVKYVAGSEALIRCPNGLTTLARLKGNGAVVTGWTYNATTKLPRFTGTTPLSNFNNAGGASGSWTAQGDTDPALGRTAGLVAVELLKLLGITTADIISANFSPYSAPVAFYVDRETPILDLLATLETTGKFHVIYRPDGKVDAVPWRETVYSANTVPIFKTDLRDARPKQWEDTSGMGTMALVRYTSTTDGPPDRLETEVQNLDWSLGTRGLERERIIETFHSDVGALSAANYAGVLEAPRRMIGPELKRRGLLCYPGTMIALTLEEAMDPDGRLDWDLYRVMKVNSIDVDGNVDLEARFMGSTLTAAGKPTGSRPH